MSSSLDDAPSLNDAPSMVNPRSRSKPLTPMQTQILRCILARPGHPPTIREIAAAVGLTSSSTIHTHLRNLMARGYVTKEAKTVRTLCLTPLAYAVLGVQPDPPTSTGGKRWVPVLRTSADVRAFLDSPHRRAPRIAPAEALTPDRTVLLPLELVQGVSR